MSQLVSVELPKGEKFKKVISDLEKWRDEVFPSNGNLVLDGDRGWTAAQIVTEIRDRCENSEWPDDFITESFLSFLKKKE